MLKRILKLLSVRSRELSPVERLRQKGAIIGDNVDIIDSYIDGCHTPLVTIGNNVTITGARILTHDASTKKYIGYTKIGFVIIGDNVFIGNGAIILPGTKIGNNVIIGSGSIVASDVPDDSVMIGNPARKLCSFNDYIDRNKSRLNSTESVVSNKLFCERTHEEWEALKNELKTHKYGFDL